MRRAALYTRISKDRAGGGLGVARQEKDCRELAERLGWTIVVVHTDNDLSAYSGKPRPGYRALLADLEADRADAVLAWHTDRLHRSPRELESFVDLCERHDVITHTVTAGELDLSTPAGRAVARTLGAWARYEVEQGVRRQRAAKKQAAGAGKWLGGPRPFGWTVEGRAIEAEAHALRSWTRDVLAGVSIASLSRAANTSGLTTSTGGRWTPTELRRVLTRPRNAGLVEHRGVVLDGVSAAWDPVVSEDEWRAVTTLVLDPTRRTNPSPSRRHLGTGLYLCGRCDDGTTLTSGTGNQGLRYRCRRQSHLTRLGKPLDDLVLVVLEARLRQPDASALLAQPEDQQEDDRNQAAATEARLRAEHLAAAFGSGLISVDAFTAGAAAAQEIVDQHAARLAQRAAGGALAGVIDTANPGDAFAALAADARSGSATFGAALGRLRALVDALLVVTVLPQHRGRPVGWTAGERAFDASSIRFNWRTS